MGLPYGVGTHKTPNGLIDACGQHGADSFCTWRVNGAPVLILKGKGFPGGQINYKKTTACLLNRGSAAMTNGGLSHTEIDNRMIPGSLNRFVDSQIW